jgi:uncharacterized repeat protein (TIGR01451 family)
MRKHRRNDPAGSGIMLALALLPLLALGASHRPALTAADALNPLMLRADASYEHIGVLWWIDGDSDLDSQLLVEFRVQGGQTWLPAAPAVRAYPTLYVQDGPLGLNYWAASAAFLTPGTAYELRLTLTDPDGGGEMRQIAASTRTRAQPDPSGSLRYVQPGSGGGSGTPTDPFRGLQAAADAALPGDIFLVAPGVYRPFQLLHSGMPARPIVFRGPADGSAVVDGGGTSRGVVTLGEYNQTVQHLILEGLTIQDGHWGVDAQNSQDIVLQHNVIQNVDDGVVNRRGSALEARQTVCDNDISGRTSWPGTGIPSERGIDLKGDGNVVCHNRVQYFGDCISVQPSTGPSYGNDVYGNDVSYCVDDGIEVDYNQANVRVWRNRVMNARMGVSLQPIRGGPAYIFRNEFFNLESVPVKMHNYTTGFYVVHNTGAKHGDGHGDNGAMWRNAVFRNNLFLGTRYAFEFTTVADEGFRDFDYNAWGTTRTIGPGGPFFKWDNVRYDTLADLPPGVEDHGVEAAFSDLVNASLPPDWDVAAPPGSRDLRLRAGAPAINTGHTLPNLNDPFVSDGQPDAGAFERQAPPPTYGPRPAAPDLSATAKSASQAAPAQGDTYTYTLQIQNTGAPLSAPLALTDTVPAGLSYIPGSLAATLGSVDDRGNPALHWTGDMGSQPTATVSYRVQVTTASSMAITNTATFGGGGTALFNRSATIIANGVMIYLPYFP